MNLINPFLKIISGAQTGVDRGALDAALELGWPCGGWCPAGRVDEDGVIPERYPVRALKKGGYSARTQQNLLDADGTVILYLSCLEGGTQETAYRCMKVKKPYLLIDAREVSISRAVERLLEFIHTTPLQSLNVAGPRASKWSGGQAYAQSLITGMLDALRSSSPVKLGMI